MLKRCPNLYFDRLPMSYDNNMDGPITMAWMFSPIDDKRIFKMGLKLRYKLILFSNIVHYDSASRDILHLAQPKLSRWSLSMIDVVDFAGLPVGSSLSSCIIIQITSS